MYLRALLVKIRSVYKTSSLKYLSLIIILTVIFSAGLMFINNTRSANAVSATEFNPGYIMSDQVFYNKDAMSAQQIQTFLDTLIPNCLTWNNRTFVDATGATVGPPYVCLNNYHENPTTGETSFEKGGGAFSGGISAAQIIYNAAQQYGINPQVLLVMLKKESLGPLTSDNWPTKYQYRYAMGYACPDSGPNNSANCNAEKAGFYKQVSLAAWQFNYYKQHPNDYRYSIGWNDIQYAPEPSCGSKRVYIENVATLSLYIYTPYTPNDASLANYPGTASCGAYGNRNFFMFFSQWFGSTTGKVSWDTMTDPRVMTIKQDTLKVTAATLQTEGDWVTAGSQVVFNSKTTLTNGEVCLRTRHDTEKNIQKCILLKRLDEFTPIYQAITDSTKNNIYVSTSTCKVNLRDVSALCDGASLFLNQEIKVSAKTTVAGTDYFITQHDNDRGVQYGIRTDRVTVSPEFTTINLVEMTVLDNARVINPSSGAVISNPQPFKTAFFDSAVTISGKRYYRQTSATSSGLYVGVEEKYLNENKFEPFISPRQLKTARKTNSINPFTKAMCQANIPISSTFHFNSKITIGDDVYFRTSSSTTNGLSCAIPATDLIEL